MATLVNIDIQHKNNAVPCVEIATTGASLYIVWSALSKYDQDIVEEAQVSFGAPIPIADLDTFILPNGMSFTSTYKHLMRPHLAKPEQYDADYNQVYYDGAAWRRVTTDAIVT